MTINKEQVKDFINYQDIIGCIVRALDAKDPYTAYHSHRVSEMAQRVCSYIGLRPKDTKEIYIAAHLHDIGKIGIPDAILYKVGNLDSEEWKLMKEHPSIGADILSKSSRLIDISKIVLHHHERFDGKGYPYGLAGHNIPVGARIIAICDSIDAITTVRSYRGAFPFDYCYNEIKNNLGIMYDPIIGEYVLEHWDEIVIIMRSTDVEG